MTSDLKSRLAKHNAREVLHTSKYAPWSLKTHLAFSDEEQAFGFGKYLKSGSGRATPAGRSDSPPVPRTSHLDDNSRHPLYHRQHQ